MPSLWRRIVHVFAGILALAVAGALTDILHWR